MLIPFLSYLLFFLIPLIVVPGFYLSFEPPKVLVSELIIAVIAVYAVFSGKINLSKIDKRLLVLVTGLFLLSLVHLILDPTRANLFGNVFRLQGTVLFWHLLILALIAQSYWFRLKDKYIYMTGFLAVVLAAFSYGTNSGGRWIGSLGEPNALGAIVIALFPFVFLSFKKLWIKVISVILALFVVNFSESKSAFIGLSIQIWFLFLLKVVKVKFVWVSISCMALVILSLILPILEQRFFLKTNTDPYAFRFEDRAEIWRVAFTAGLENPVYGFGLESIQDQIKTTARDLNVNAQYQVIDSSHNIFLDYWVWGGGIGLLLLLSLVFLTIQNLIRKKMIIEMLVFIGLLTVLSFNPTTVTILIMFWWVIGRSFAKISAE